MKSKCTLVLPALFTATLAVSAAQAQSVEMYTGDSRISDPDGCALFCCINTNDPLQNYEEDGLTVHVDDFEYSYVPCGFNDGNYYPNAGVNERVNITRTDGGDFGRLEFQASDGWGSCEGYLWATAYLDNVSMGDFSLDFYAGDLIGFEGAFDELRVAAYFDAVTRDEMNEIGYNAIAIDNACWEGEVSACLTLAVDPLVAGSSASWNVSDATAGEQVAIVYGFAPGSTIVNGFAGYCASFGIQGVNQNKVICTKAADGAGNATCTKKIPAGVKGRRILSQAAERNTCPDECVSNLDDQTVG